MSSAITGSSAELGEDGLTVSWSELTLRNFFLTLRYKAGGHGALPGDLRGSGMRMGSLPLGQVQAESLLTAVGCRASKFP